MRLRIAAIILAALGLASSSFLYLQFQPTTSSRSVTLQVSGPSIIGYSTHGESLAATGVLPKLFKIQDGTIYAWFSDGTNGGYSCSFDNGRSWTPINPIHEANRGLWTVDFNGRYVDYAIFDRGSIYYRRGVPSLCSIAWLAPEQLVLAANGTTKFAPAVLGIDTADRPWIAFRTNSNSGTRLRPWLLTSSTTDGTWRTAVGFPIRLADTPGDWWCSIVPLSFGIVINYAATGTPSYARAWYTHNQSLGSQETISTWPMLQSEDRAMVVGLDDRVHYVFLGSTTQMNSSAAYPIIYASRSPTGIWTSSIVNAISNYGTHLTIILDRAKSDAYVFYANSPTYNSFYLQRILANGQVSPEPPIELLNDPYLMHQYQTNTLQSYEYVADDGTIGFAYEAGITSPWANKFFLFATAQSTSAMSQTESLPQPAHRGSQLLLVVSVIAALLVAVAGWIRYRRKSARQLCYAGCG